MKPELLSYTLDRKTREKVHRNSRESFSDSLKSLLKEGHRQALATQRRLSPLPPFPLPAEK